MLSLGVALLAALAAPCSAGQGGPGTISARRALAPPVVDGRLDEADWGRAAWTGRFVDIVDGAPGRLDSRCALLWDDTALYVAFRVAEPDLRAALTRRDAPIYEDNDVELFIAGPNAYWELELNALGTVYDVLWLWEDAYGPGGAAALWPDLAPGSAARREILRIDGIAGHVHPRGWRTGVIGWDLPGLRTAVHVDGTLNDPSDVDQGWTVEIAVPWASLSRLVPGAPLPPGPGTLPLRLDCSRFEHFDAGGARLSRPAGWALRRHGAFDSHMPETFPALRLEPGTAQ